MRKCLIIDGQILQTDAWHRGMGKYTVQLLQSFNDRVGDDLSFALIFNSAIDTDAERFDYIKQLCPNVTQYLYNLPLAKDSLQTKEQYKTVLQDHLATDFSQVERYYLVTSPFYFDFFADFPDNCKKLMLFYDLTPFLFWRDLGGYFPPELYFERFQKILDADHIFGISSTTCADVRNYLGLSEIAVTNINGGFTKISPKPTRPHAFEVPRRYILFPTGDLPHKNNEMAVAGFEHYISMYGADLPLLITSRFNETSKKRLQALSSHIHFTENVSDDELEWLYEHASAVLFASKYEGLGMPILDAVASNKPIITSDIPVFKEMSKQAFYYFDSNDPTDLAAQLDRALRKDDFAQKLQGYAAIMRKYTWQNTASGITDYILTATTKSAKQKPLNRKSRIAVACVHPGISGQIGRLAEPLHAHLRASFDIDYFFDANGYHYRDMERPTFLDFIDTKSLDITKLTLKTYRHYDAVVYLLDRAAYPSRVAQRATVLPGISVTNKRHHKAPAAVDAAFEQLVTRNQLADFDLGVSDYVAMEQFSKWLKTIVEQPRTESQSIIRNGHTNRGIIKRLLALRDDA